jgi:glutamate/tyrosine decarboxylase-like PLP-dependent enzyme
VTAPLPEVGRPVDDVLADIEERRRADLRPERATAYHFESGRPELADLVTRAGALMLGTNALNPTAFPSIASLENDLVAATAQLHGGDARTAGTLPSGGTESCLLAVLAAREQWRAENGDSRVPRLVLPATAHPAFRKAAHLFGLEVAQVPVDPTTFALDPADVATRLDEPAALVVVSAPEYAHGTLDPVADVAALAASRGVLCHLDGCIGGWVLPFVQADEGRPPVDLSVPGVTSMSVDLHKYGYAPKGASVVLFESEPLRRRAWFADAAWPGYPLVNGTLLSSRSAAPAAAAWAVLQHLGVAGLRDLAARARAATLRLAEAVERIDGLRVAAPPSATLLAVIDDGDPHGPDIRVVVDEMAGRGWPVQAQPARLGAPGSFHVTMTGAVAARVEELVAALSDATAAARTAGRAEVDPQVMAAVGSWGSAELSDDVVEGLLALVGVGDGDAAHVLPARMASVNALMDAVPPALVERLLVAVASRVYGAAGGAASVRAVL